VVTPLIDSAAPSLQRGLGVREQGAGDLQLLGIRRAGDRETYRGRVGVWLGQRSVHPRNVDCRKPHRRLVA
jgi:hypothetical protein